VTEGDQDAAEIIIDAPVTSHIQRIKLVRFQKHRAQEHERQPCTVSDQDHLLVDARAQLARQHTQLHERHAKQHQPAHAPHDEYQCQVKLHECHEWGTLHERVNVSSAVCGHLGRNVFFIRREYGPNLLPLVESLLLLLVGNLTVCLLTFDFGNLRLKFLYVERAPEIYQQRYRQQNAGNRYKCPGGRLA
jgi:hypothetical protein